MNSNAALPAPDLYARVHAFLEVHDLLGKPLLVGVSGGMDSTVLLRVLVELGLPLYASHIHYGLRGADSDADAAFVHTLCDVLRIPLDVFRAPSAPLSGKQAWAREVRYARWLHLAETHKLSAVAVAHHAEDQLETMLLNATRGAGLRGFGGMKPVRPWSASRVEPWVIRPLLDVSREELAALATQNGWTWREDASNEDSAAYRRNALRYRVVRPLAVWAGAGGMRNLVHTLKRVQDLEDTLKSLLPTLEDHRLDLAAVRVLPEGVHPHVLREAFRAAFPDARADEPLTRRLVALLDQQPGRKVEFPGGEVRRLRDALWFVPQDRLEVRRLAKTLLHLGMTLETGAGMLSVRACGTDACLRIPHEASEPLWVRTWEAGDRAVPLGRSREVRVSDLLVKAKVPLDLKPVWPVVGCGERIVWVPGVGANEACCAPENEPSWHLSFDSARS